MSVFAATVACSLLLLSAEGASTAPLPRSSIAAVIAERGALGLTDAEVAELERRDEALQKQLGEIRDELPASPHPGAGARRSAPEDRRSQPLSPSAAALPQGAGRGVGRGGGRAGGGSGPKERDPADRGAQLQSRLDDADTAAWLSAETTLDPSRREKAREVAAAYREQLADRRDAEHAGKKDP
jgi:hypothetical protein